MNYQESKQILKEIRKANNILINCHRNPDPDSVGSALALYNVLMAMGKTVDVVCASTEIYEPVSYLTGYSKIQKNVDFKQFDHSRYDLFISPDTSTFERVTDNKDIPVFQTKTVVIDHHKTNTRFGTINLVDDKKTSVGELLFDLFSDWNFEIGKETADCLMVAIVGDTGAFRYPHSTTHTFYVVQKLMEIGADKDRAIFSIYRNDDFNILKFWGEILSRLCIDQERKYVWSAVPYEIFKKYGKPPTGRETAASAFTQTVKDTNFGFIAVEQEKNHLRISFRSRTGFDTSEIASDLGGGGHVYASGGHIENMQFEEAVNYLLKTVNKHCDSES